MLSLIPWYYRLAAVAALGAALFGYGYYRGHAGEKAHADAVQGQFDAFRSEVKAAGEAAAKHTAEVTANQEAESAKIAQDYRSQLASLRARGVPNATDPRGRPIAVFPETACRADAGPADKVPAQPAAVEAVSKADFDELAGLSAQTTLQLLGLQRWVAEQQRLMP